VETTNSIHYLVGFWSRLTVAVSFLNDKSEGLRFLDSFIPDVAREFVKSKLQSMNSVSYPEDFDTLFQEPNLTDHLDVLPSLCRFKYDKSAQHLHGTLREVMDEYARVLQMLSNQPSSEQQRTISVMEGKLAMGVYMIGSTISRGGLIRAPDERMKLDASLCALVFEFIQFIDLRLQNCQLEMLKHIDMAILYFLRKFKDAYIGTSPKSNAATGEEKATIFTCLSEVMNVEDVSELTVLSVMLDKIILALRVWPNEDAMIELCLKFLESLSHGYHSSQLMSELDSAKNILQNHSDLFPFIHENDNMEWRKAFYTTLSRFLFDGNEEMFDGFFYSFDEKFSKLSNSDLSNREVAEFFCGLCYDLTGICAGIRRSKAYVMFFEWIHPNHFKWLTRLLETWSSVPEITTPILTFVAEFVENRSQRVNFDVSCPSAIVLFQEASRIIVTYGTKVAQMRSGPDDDDDDDDEGQEDMQSLEKERIDGITWCMDILASSLKGGYVNFGIFS